MTTNEAHALAEFIKDHDKRFEAKAVEDPNPHVLLTLASDGTRLEPITEIAQYHTNFIEQDDPGPTVRAAWDKWQPTPAA